MSRRAGVALAGLLAVRAGAQPAAETPDCCQVPLSVSYSHVVDAGRHVTKTAIEVPAPYVEVANRLEDVAAYGTWLFTGPAGEPTLHGVSHDAATGALALTIGRSSTGIGLAGTLTRERTAGAIVLRAKGSAEDVQEWAFVLEARPVGACTSRTRVELEIDITYGLKARLFGGSAKSMPSLLALAARDDIASLFVHVPERLACLGIAGVTPGEHGAVLHAKAGSPPVRVLRCRPYAITVGSEAARAFAARLQPPKGQKPGEVFAAMDEVLEGTHRIATWRLDYEGGKGAIAPEMPGAGTGTVHCDVVVQPQGEGFGMTVGAGASP